MNQCSPPGSVRVTEALRLYPRIHTHKLKKPSKEVLLRSELSPGLRGLVDKWVGTHSLLQTKTAACLDFCLSFSREMGVGE